MWKIDDNDNNAARYEAPPAAAIHRVIERYSNITIRLCVMFNCQPAWVTRSLWYSKTSAAWWRVNKPLINPNTKLWFRSNVRLGEWKRIVSTVPHLFFCFVFSIEWYTWQAVSCIIGCSTNHMLVRTCASTGRYNVLILSVIPSTK